MDSERMDEVAQDIGETAEALDRLLGRGEAERAPGGVPTSPELPSDNGEGEASPQAAPQPEKEPEMVPVAESAGGMLEITPAVEANYPETGRLPKKKNTKS